MKKVAIVGVEGSGKTVLMAAMGDKYESPDFNGVFLKPVNRETYSYYTKEMAELRNGKWPLATESSVLELDWMLVRQSGPNATQEQLGQLSFLDFGGEIYRRAFGDRAQAELDDEDEQRKAAVERLRAHVENADALIVLVNLSDIINGKGNDERTIEMNWLSQAILSFAYEKAEKKNVALVFTQVDTYAETIANCGGVRGTLAKCLRVVDSNYGSRLSLFEVAAVDKTIPAQDGSGLPVPAPEFEPKGLEPLLGWIVKAVEPQRKRHGCLFATGALLIGGLVSAGIGYMVNADFKNWADGRLTAVGWTKQETPVHPEQRPAMPSVKPAATPTKLTVEPAKRKCSACNGQGKTDCGNCKGNGRINCSKCGGSGRVETTVRDECSKCNGRASYRCEACRGNGKVWETEEKECRKCRGEGEVRCSICLGLKRLPTGNPWMPYQPCWKCDGTGREDCPNRQSISDRCVDGMVEHRKRVDCISCFGDGAQHCDKCNDGYRTRKSTEDCSRCSGIGTVICPRTECHSGKVSCASCNGDGWVTE